MDKGTILHHSEFQFHNGGVSKKLLIILNNPKKNQPYLVCTTTSKQKYGIQQEGCHSDKNIYVLNPNYDFFEEKTWVQFHKLYMFRSAELLNLHHRNRVLHVAGKLRENTINAIRNCIKRSIDITEHHLTLLN